jgi:hypothetical protein
MDNEIRKLKGGAQVLVRWVKLVQRTGASYSIRSWVATSEQARVSVGSDWERARVVDGFNEEGVDIPTMIHVIYVEGDMKDHTDVVPVSEVRRADVAGAIVSWPVCRHISGGSCMMSHTTGVPDLVRRVPTALLSHPLLWKG